jgi:hypothetical protein
MRVKRVPGNGSRALQEVLQTRALKSTWKGGKHDHMAWGHKSQRDGEGEGGYMSGGTPSLLHQALYRDGRVCIRVEERHRGFAELGPACDADRKIRTRLWCSFGHGLRSTQHILMNIAHVP